MVSNGDYQKLWRKEIQRDLNTKDKEEERKWVPRKRETTKSQELSGKTETKAHGKAPRPEDNNQSLLWCEILARS